MPTAPEGRTQPRLFTPPLRELTEQTTLGYQAVDFAESVCKITLNPWQRWLLIHALELDPSLTVDTMDQRGHLDPLFRFRRVVVLVARQNGKSTISQVLSLFCLYCLGTRLVLGTAQDLDTAEETWDGAMEIVEETPSLKALADRPILVNGKKAMRLKTGERYKVKAANRKAGRGQSGDLILLDELREHTNWDSWAAITKTTVARPSAQIWALSNAGDVSSVVLRYLRKAAHQALGDPDGLNSLDNAFPTQEPEEDPGGFESLGLFEWSAEPGLPVNDRDGILQANPSIGHTVSLATLLSDARNDPEWVFRTECLCQWAEGALRSVFPAGAWESGRIDSREQAGVIEGKVHAGVGVTSDRSVAYLAYAGRTTAGRVQVEVVARRAGVEWVEAWLKGFNSSGQRRLDRVESIAGQGRGAPESSLLEELLLGGLPVVKWEGSELPAGTGRFFDAVRDNQVDHLVAPELDAAAATAVKKESESGAFMWDSKRSPTDIAVLRAVNAAYWACTRTEPEKPQSAYAGYDLLVV